MPHFVQSFETARWCVDHQPLDVEQGMVVRFGREDEAAHFVSQGRAGYIGQCNSFEEAFDRLATIHEEIAAAKAAEEAEAARKAAEDDPNTGSKTGTDDGESASEQPAPAPAPASAPAPKPAKPKAKAPPQTA